MWWWLGCAPQESNERAEAEQGALEAEIAALDQRLGAATTRLGSLETDFERRMAAAEGELAEIAEERAKRAEASKPSAIERWLGAWTVRAEASANHGCDGAVEPSSYRWVIGRTEAPDRLMLSVEGGDTRFRSFSLRVEPETGALTGSQFIGADASFVLLRREGEGFVGHRVYNSAGHTPCARIWRIEGERP